MPFAQARPGWQTPPPLSNSTLRPRTTELMRFPQRRLVLWLWLALAQVLLRSFRPVFLRARQTTAPRFWLSHLGLTPPSHYLNTAPASSVVSSLSTTPLPPRRPRFTAELTLSRPLVAWRSLTLVPHRPSSDATYWIACSSISGVVLANLALYKLRRACD